MLLQLVSSSQNEGNGGTVDIASAEVTVLLSQLAKGNQEAESKLIFLVYGELRRMAARYMRREREDHTLQTTALVHEAYLKLVEQHSVDWQSRSHFFGIAAQVMRRVLLDHARGHVRDKRGGGQQNLRLDEAFVFSPERSAAFLELDQALDRLAAIDHRQAKIVELRFFGGLNVEEVADLLQISPKTVKRDWSVAKAWLHGELKEAYDGGVGEMGKH
jgi:RNA polymerase sigma-70 factor (ECF subfamily)